MVWIKKQIWKILLLITGTGVVLAAPSVVDQSKIFQLPDHQKLKAPIERIVGHRKIGTSTISYAVISKKISDKYPNEVSRTNNTVTQHIGKNKYVVTSFLGQRFYRETRNDEWKDVSYSTTTIDAFELQTGNVVQAADTGFNNPSATGDDYNEWIDPEDAFTSDGRYAGQSAANQMQDYYNFSFGVPTGATIDGIEATFEGDTLGPYTGDMLDVDLSHDGGTTYASDIKEVVDNSNSPGDITDTLGGSSDTWGRTWSDSELSNANFRLRAEADNPSGAWSVDHIQVKIYYTETAAESRRINITNPW